MKAVIIATLALVAFVAARPEDKYTDKYDNIDLDQILNNRRLLVPYVECVLGNRPCTADGKELKSHLTDALQTGCGKCTEAQNKGSRRVIKHLLNKEPELWAKLQAKYDPDHKYTQKYEEELLELKKH